MGDFLEPEVEDHTDIPVPVKPGVFTNEFITKVVKDSMEKGTMPVDHKLAFVGFVDEKGVRGVVSVQVMNRKLVGGKLEFDAKLQAVVEHEWTGENKAGAQLLFSVK